MLYHAVFRILVKKPNTIVGFAVLACTGILLTIGGSAAMDQAGMDEQGPPQAETSKYDLPVINESNIKENISNFTLMAQFGGEVITSTDAEAYLFGSTKPRNCLTLTGVIACGLVGPVKMLLVYKDDEKFFEIPESKDAICYIGRRGIFCDGADLSRSKDYSIDVSPLEKRRRCLYGHKSSLCIALGPAHIDMNHEGTLSAFELDEGMHAVCYSGAAGSFCDVYENASIDNNP